MKTLTSFLTILFVIFIIPSCNQENHVPEIADQTFYLDENSEPGTIVGVIEAHDLDEEGALKFDIVGGNTDNAFTLEQSSGELRVNNAAALDYEKIQSIDLKVRVSDSHPDEPMESSATVKIILNDLNEFAPVIEEQTFTVNERSPEGTIVGTIVATDPDSGQELTFRIESGNEDQVIRLDSVTGELAVADSAWFNSELNQKLVCMVSVSDNDNKHPMKSYTLITIEVMDVPYMTVDISGYVQKGPFILGSPITISELQSDLQPTGRVFTTQIMDNSGKYELPDVELESQYLLLKADGFYFNERTGGLSQAQLTLFNLVDITEQESFNINVISHLEKERIMHLMGSGIEFSEAKQLAKNEILDIFGYASIDQLPSEQMSIASEGEDNAMLLASSLILQGDRSTGEFSELLSQISLDYREDGTMDSESLGSKLINGIYYGKLQEIRSYIENRYADIGIAYVIPEFEKYVRAFLDNTGFQLTRFIEYPQYSNYGENILYADKTDIIPEVWYSMAAILPEGADLKVVISGGLWYLVAMPDGPVNWSKTTYDSEAKRQIFTAMETGKSCDLKIQFKAPFMETGDTTDLSGIIQDNEITIEYFENNSVTATRTKTILFDLQK